MSCATQLIIKRNLTANKLNQALYDIGVVVSAKYLYQIDKEGKGHLCGETKEGKQVVLFVILHCDYHTDYAGVFTPAELRDKKPYTYISMGSSEENYILLKRLASKYGGYVRENDCSDDVFEKITKVTDKARNAVDCGTCKNCFHYPVCKRAERVIVPLCACKHGVHIASVYVKRD